MAPRALTLQQKEYKTTPDPPHLPRNNKTGVGELPKHTGNTQNKVSAQEGRNWMK